MDKNKEEPKQKADEVYVGVYDNNHVIYYRRSTGRFFAKKHGQVLSEDETSLMTSNMEAAKPSFKTELEEFKKKEGL